MPREEPRGSARRTSGRCMGPSPACAHGLPYAHPRPASRRQGAPPARRRTTAGSQAARDDGYRQTRRQCWRACARVRCARAPASPTPRERARAAPHARAMGSLTPPPVRVVRGGPLVRVPVQSRAPRGCPPAPRTGWTAGAHARPSRSPGASSSPGTRGGATCTPPVCFSQGSDAVRTSLHAQANGTRRNMHREEDAPGGRGMPRHPPTFPFTF